MPCMGDNFSLESESRGFYDNSELRRSYITHCEWHKALLATTATSHRYDTHSHNGQRHLFSKLNKKTKHQ